MDKVFIANESDRMAMTAILVKNKYRVRSGSQQRPGAKSYDYYLEIELGTQKDAPDKLQIKGEEDQLTAAAILVKNKYTVKSYSQEKAGVREYFYLEYEPNLDNPAVFPKSRKKDTE